MRNILLFSGTVLLALVMQGCATTADNPRAAAAHYEEVKSRLADYQLVGDAKIDGLARPFVTGAFQTKADVEKASEEIEGSPIQKLLGNEKPENAAQAYKNLKPEQRAAIDNWLAARSKADSARLDTLFKQLSDLAVAGGQLAIEINNAAGGGSGGQAALAKSAMSAASGPGKKAADQVKTAVEFCSASADLIKTFKQTSDQVRGATDSNTRKAQS